MHSSMVHRLASPLPPLVFVLRSGGGGGRSSLNGSLSAACAAVSGSSTSAAARWLRLAGSSSSVYAGKGCRVAPFVRRSQ